MSDSLQPYGLLLARLLCPLNSPGKNTGVGHHFFFQRIFLTQESNPRLLHCMSILYHRATGEAPFSKDTTSLILMIDLAFKMVYGVISLKHTWGLGGAYSGTHSSLIWVLGSCRAAVAGRGQGCKQWGKAERLHSWRGITQGSPFHPIDTLTSLTGSSIPNTSIKTFTRKTDKSKDK